METIDLALTSGSNRTREIALLVVIYNYLPLYFLHNINW